MPDSSIFHKSRVPMYLQVAKLMRQKIERGEWRFGEQIPTLEQLGKTHEISRITLRAALDQLEQQGLIRRTRGLGTFVAKDLSEQRWFKLACTYNALVNTAEDTRIRRLAIEPLAPSALRLTPASPFGEVGLGFQRLRRVKYNDGLPYCVAEVHLDQKIFDSNPEGFGNAPILPLLAARSDIHVAQAKQVLRITVCDEETASHLDIGVGEPIADVCRALLDENRRIFYYAHLQFPAHMVQLEMDLLPALLAK